MDICRCRHPRSSHADTGHRECVAISCPCREYDQQPEPSLTVEALERDLRESGIVTISISYDGGVKEVTITLKIIELKTGLEHSAKLVTTSPNNKAVEDAIAFALKWARNFQSTGI